MYEFFDHTADVRMRASGETRGDLFAEALKGMMALLRPEEAEGKETVERKIALAAPDWAMLLVDFLNEALALAASNKEAYGSVVFDRLEDGGLDARLAGWPVSGFGDDVKAVTHHEAAVRPRAGGGWEADLIFDL